MTQLVGLSYTCARELVLEKLEVIGLDKHQVGVHSLHSRGASATTQTTRSLEEQECQEWLCEGQVAR